MTVTQIYDAVLTVRREQARDRLAQRPFFLFVNKRIREIVSLYPSTALPEGVVQPIIDEITDPILLDDGFFYPLVWGILYEAGDGDAYAIEAAAAARAADRAKKRQGKKYIEKRRF